MTYARAMKRLSGLLKAQEALNEVVNDAAEDVLEAAKVRRRSSPDPSSSNPLTPFRAADFERYVRRAWSQARTKAQRNNVRKMLRDGATHGLLSPSVSQELGNEFGEDE